VLFSAGCSKSAVNLRKSIDGIKDGMTVGDVKRVLGQGQEVAYEQLPADARESIPKTDGATYHVWIYRCPHCDYWAWFSAEFEDGKLANNVFMESGRNGCFKH
jgi:hypothetical protein